jgi:hypothetical protein
MGWVDVYVMWLGAGLLAYAGIVTWLAVKWRPGGVRKVRKNGDMKALTKDEFARAVLGLPGPQVPFQPEAVYIPEGDCIEFVVAPDDHFARRIDGLVTVYYSRKTGNIVGALIKGVKGRNWRDVLEHMVELYEDGVFEMEFKAYADSVAANPAEREAIRAEHNEWDVTLKDGLDKHDF